VKVETVYGGAPGQRFWECGACKVIYLHPTTSDADDKAFYEQDFDKWMAKRSGDESWSKPEVQFEKLGGREMPLRMPWLEKLTRPGQRVLEIGSSSGFTLEALKKRGCECTGIELSPEYADYARSRGISTHSSLKALEKSGEKFDLVLHYYVLEHVNEPRTFLEECLRYLAPGGKLMFEVPASSDPLTSLYRIPAFDKFYWWRAHHWYFNRESLGFLLGQLGRPFEIHPGQRYDLSNHLHWAITGQPGGLGKYSYIFGTETERAYAEDLKRSWHCDYLIAIVSQA
jgi:SAM-dependent methyltransferase